MRRIPQDNLNRYSLEGSPFVHGFKNRLINGNFDLWQRGTSLGSGTGTRYLADRWQSSSVGTTYTSSQQSFTLGQIAVPGEPQFFHRIVVTSVAGAGNFCSFAQRVESVRTFAGQTITLSFWAKADASKNIAVEFSQSFGTGGAPSATVTGVGVTTIALTTAFQKFAVTVSIPSISGKTLGTDNNSALDVNFWFDAGSTFNSRTNSLGQQSGTFDIAQVQLEPGSVATAFEQRHIGTELALAQRYYQKSFPLATTPAQASGATAGQAGYRIHTSGLFLDGTMVYFSVRMRGIPTIVFYSLSSLNSTWRSSGGTDSGIASAVNVGDTGFFANNPQVAGDVAQNFASIHWAAEAEL